MNNRDNQNSEPARPELLRAALSRLNGCRITVPTQVDDAILQAARKHLAGAQTTEVAETRELVSHHFADRKQSQAKVWCEEFGAGLREFFAVRRRFMWGGMAVAMVAVGVLVWLGGRSSLAAGPEDLNGDGVVDMLDAFALARALQHTPASHPKLDFNGDGMVDERDVQTLATHAVSLEPGGRS
jgi:hypothetical protein